MISTSDVTIAEAVIDPRWKVGVVVVNGARLTFIRITHPRHGDVDLILPDESAVGLSTTLRDTVNSNA